MKSTNGLRDLSHRALAISGLLICTAGAVLAAPESRAAAPNSSQVLSDVILLDEINQLSLTQAQVQNITRSLSQLEAADIAYNRRQDAVVKPLLQPLLRIRTALAQNRNPDAADQKAVSTALAPLDAARSRLADLRQQTADAIRQQLTRPQIDLVRLGVGMSAAGDTPAAAAAFGVLPGADWTQAGPWTEAGLDTNAAAAAQSNPWMTANVNQAAAQVLTLLDGARVEPLLDFNRDRSAIASQLASATGATPGTTEFTAVRSNMNDLLDQTRALNQLDYQAAREQIAGQLALEAYASQLQSAQMVKDAMAAVAAGDTQAVGTFFLRADVLHALQQKLAKGSVRSTTGTPGAGGQ